MSSTRRSFMLALLGFGMGSVRSYAGSVKYPLKPVTIVVPFPPGSILDTTARMLAQRASRTLGQSVIVENKPGATGNLGSAYVANASPDGHVLLMTIDTAITVNPFVYSNMGFDPLKDLIPVSTAGSFGGVLLAHPSLGVANFDDFVRLAREKELFYSSGGAGSPGHLAFELLKQKINIPGTHVPYKGNAPALQALLAGEVGVGFLVIPGALQLIASKKLVPLMVPGEIRDALLPDVPSASEVGIPDFDTETALVMLAPASTPDSVLQVWETEVRGGSGFPRKAVSHGVAHECQECPVHAAMACGGQYALEDAYPGKRHQARVNFPHCGRSRSVPVTASP